MEIIWSDNDCDAIIQFVDNVLANFNVVVTDIDGDVTNVRVSGTGREGEGGLLTLEGWRLNADFDLTDDQDEWWLVWDDIAKLEVH